MAFIIEKNPVLLNIMLTSKGRELLSTGNLTFKYFAIGDGETDYGFIEQINNVVNPDYNVSNSFVLRPKDKNPQISSFVRKISTGDSYNSFSGLSANSYTVIRKANSIGFFNSGGTTFLNDNNHIKQPDAMIYMSGVTGGNELVLRKASTYGSSGDEPNIGDLILVKWTYDLDTTGYTINKNKPSPYLMYKIIDKEGALEDDLLYILVDRDIPDFSSFAPTGKAGAFIFYSAITTDHKYSTDYLSKSVLDFLGNYQCAIEEFPFWNMSIVFTEEIAGIQDIDKKFTNFVTKKYGGFVSYIQNQAPLYKKLGIIHYTNNSPANTYGDEFYLKTSKLQIPTIMWHKSSGTTMGITVTPVGKSKTLSGNTKSLDIEYYNLADSMGNVVGKVFNTLKLFVIEDQELLFAMSYNSNRSWTLPNYGVSGGTVPCLPCPPCPNVSTTTTNAPITQFSKTPIITIDSMTTPIISKNKKHKQ